MKVNTAKRVILEDNSISWKIDISFDITDEGIVFGVKRNYNPSFISSLIRSKATKQAIEKGYALVMYGHDSRDRKKLGGWTSEYHPVTKKPQFPLGKVTHISIKGNIVNIKMLIAEADKNDGSTIAGLIKNGIGGFSTFFSVREKMLLGCDYVLTRNFAGNSVDEVLMDSICSDGSCDIGSIVNNLAKEMVGDSSELLEGAANLLSKDPSIEKFQRLHKLIEQLSVEAKEATEKLGSCKAIIEQKDKEISLKNKHIEDLEHSIRATQKDLLESISKNKKLMSEKKVIKEESEKASIDIEKALVGKGITLDKKDGSINVEVDKSVYKDLFLSGIIEDSIDPLKLKKASMINKQKSINPTSNTFSTFLSHYL